MGLKLDDLDRLTRRHMLREFVEDLERGNLVISPRLTMAGRKAWPTLLREAIEREGDEWLAAQLKQFDCLERFERAFRWESPLYYVRRVPRNAADMLAEAEFNRYYIRGLCLRALHEGMAEVEVYRAKDVAEPRPESQALLGTRVSCDRLLDDVRRSSRVLKIPGGPNSGISVRLPAERQEAVA